MRRVLVECTTIPEVDRAVCENCYVRVVIIIRPEGYRYDWCAFFLNNKFFFLNWFS